MRLRTRITLGYGYLVAVVVVSVASAAMSFQQLGRSIGRVLQENFQSVEASMHMLEALERQDSAVLSLLLEHAGAGQLLRDSEKSFEENLARAADNITIDEEQGAIDSIRVSFVAYRQARDKLLQDTYEHPLQAYDQETSPRFEAVKADVVQLLSLNHRAMIAADQATQRSASHRAVALAFLVSLAVISLGLLSRGLNRDLLIRLGELQAFAASISRGELRQRAPIGQQDELGALAHALNRVLDRQQEIEGRARARLVTHRQLLLGMLHGQATGALVTTLSGDLVASTLPDEATESIVREIRALGAGELERRDGFRLGGESLKGKIALRPLWVEDSRPVGWLATQLPEA